MKSKITPEIVEQINELLKEKTQKEVAEILKLNPATVSKYSNKKKVRKEITPELINEINEKYKEYRNLSRVAKELNISYATAGKYLSEENKELKKKNYDDRDALFYYIIRLFGVNSEEEPVSTHNLTLMNRMLNQGISYKAQLLTLKYFYEIKRNKVKEEYKTIGIITYVLKDSINYYREKAAEQKLIEEQIKKQLEKDRIEIPYNPSQFLYKKRKKKKQIDLDSIE